MTSLDPVLLFFILGLTAGLLRSELRLPAPVYELVSMLLLMAIGLKGGIELARQPFGELAASASYIAVPAAMGVSVPEANPTLSLTASLGVTFPFNVLIGIPLYHALTVKAFELTGA